MAEGDSELQDLYREVLIDYFREGAHKGCVENPSMSSHGVNPSCGDEIELTALVRDGRLEKIRYSGHGCVISQASSAMMAEALEGRTLEEARALTASFKGFMLEGVSPESLPDELSETRALEGVRKFPLRIKCSLLGWNTLLQALNEAGSTKGGTHAA